MIRLFTLGTLLLLAGCTQMSEHFYDETAGMNGSFEVSKNDLPVNWILYTPNTVKEGDFKIILDKDNYKDGIQSLKFEVIKCSSDGGWYSPGFTQEFDADPNSQYMLSFWIKNDRTEFRISAGGVAPMTGDMKTLLQVSESINDWKLYEYTIEVAEEFETLRLEVNVLQPGSFWIDDIRITAI